MRPTQFAILAVLATGLIFASPAGAAYHAPRTPGGDPDLQGEWSNLSLTDLERPKKLTHLKLTDAEAAAREKQIMESIAHPKDDEVGQTTSEWFELGHLGRIDGVARSSWIVDPADGKLPYTAAGKAMQKRWDDTDTQGFDNPEDRPNGERCLIAPGSATGPPMLNTGISSYYKIVQTRGVVAIFSELGHAIRIVRLGGAHLPASIHPWAGDSIGHFEQDVLVVETTQFNPGEINRDDFQISPDAKVVEKFWRISPSEMLYSFTVTDPAFYTQPWTGQIPMRISKVPLFEYACHEGNYALADILAGARETEAKAKTKARAVEQKSASK